MRPIDGTIFYHQHCFDGLISAAVAWDILETAFGWRIGRAIPITYTVKEWWLTSAFPRQAAIVDFLFHPCAEFWVDHHGTTFLTERAQLDYLAARGSARTFIYDKTSPAGAKLLWDHLLSGSSDPGRYAEMVRWATLTDSAAYADAYQGVFGDAPALRVDKVLTTNLDPTAVDAVLGALRRGTLDELAASPIIAEPYRVLRPKIEAGLAQIGSASVVLSDGTMAYYETRVSGEDHLPRYGTFLLHPDIRYSVALVHSDRGPKISASRNPWGPPTRAKLGTIMRAYGGGGHDAVASLHLAPGLAAQAQTIAQHILRDIAAAEENVTAPIAA